MRFSAVLPYLISAVFAIHFGCAGGSSPTNTSTVPPPTSTPVPSAPGPTPVPPPAASAGPLSGVWSGSMQVTTPAGQSPLTLTVTLNHTVNGQSTITGALAITDSPCFTPTTLPIPLALFQNPSFILDVPTSNGTFHLVGQLADAATLAAQFEMRGGTCDRMAGTGTLKKQISSASTPGIRIAFKVAQGGTYGGELWVFPPTFVIGGCLAEARAHAVDAAGVSQAVSASWAPDNPAMVAISPRDGHQTTITVLATGTSNVRVSAAGFPSKLLNVQAAPSNNSIICTFSQ